jgi:hypothetical protein
MRASRQPCQRGRSAYGSTCWRGIDDVPSDPIGAPNGGSGAPTARVAEYPRRSQCQDSNPGGPQRRITICTGLPSGSAIQAARSELRKSCGGLSTRTPFPLRSANAASTSSLHTTTSARGGPVPAVTPAEDPAHYGRLSAPWTGIQQSTTGVQVRRQCARGYQMRLGVVGSAAGPVSGSPGGRQAATAELLLTAPDWPGRFTAPLLRPTVRPGASRAGPVRRVVIPGHCGAACAG